MLIKSLIVLLLSFLYGRLSKAGSNNISLREHYDEGYYQGYQQGFENSMREIKDVYNSMEYELKGFSAGAVRHSTQDCYICYLIHRPSKELINKTKEKNNV